MAGKVVTWLVALAAKLVSSSTSFEPLVPLHTKTGPRSSFREALKFELFLRSHGQISNEILHRIFLELPQRILKLVRLCCGRWSSISTEHLFEQIYFASRSEPIRRFKGIVREPHISACVKHLVFDDTQLSKRLLEPLPHALRLPEHRAWSYSEHRTALDAFCQHYHHQQRISATSEDLTVLLQGLPRLSSLKKCL